jgi:putative ABC transport system permease protein
MDALVQDLRYALRTLAKAPGFAVVAVLTLGLGIGGTTVIFSLINALLLRPPAHVQQADRLVALFTSDYSGPPFGSSSIPDIEDFARQTDVLSGLAAFGQRPVSFIAGDEPHRALAELVSGNYFTLLGLTPAVGRLLRPDEGTASGAAPVAVLGYGLWQRRFGGDPAVVGSTIRMSGHPFTIVGVAPPGFSGLVNGLDVGVWIPLSQQPVLQPGSQDLVQRGDRGWWAVGRLQPNMGIDDARARFAVLARRLHDTYPDVWTDIQSAGRRITVVPEQEARIFPEIRGSLIGFLAILMVVASLVLLICCANLANLLLARGARRRQEIAVRLALGAARRRLVRQFLTESLTLAFAGAVTGALLAAWINRLLRAISLPVPVPLALDLRLDPRVLFFTLTTAGCAAVLFGLLPALHATRPDLVASLKQAPGATGRRRRFAVQDFLVGGQVAVTLVLLVGAGLLVRSLRHAQRFDLGFDPHGLALIAVEPSIQGYTGERAATYYGDLTERLAALPSVQALGLAARLPLGLDFERRGVTVQGYQPRPGEDMEFGANTVGPGYFATMRIPIARGREFTDADRAGAPGAVIVNETFARRFWPGADPIGKRVNDLQVVGVARDGKYGSLAEEPRPFFYTSALQAMSPARAVDLTVVVRTTADPRALLPVLRREAHALDPDLPLQIATMGQHLGVAVFPQRAGSFVLGLFGALGLALATLGLYGVMAYAVAQRTREIGIRMALGAAAADVRRLAVRRGLAVTGAGMLVGLVLATVAGRLITSILFGVSGNDPVTLVGVLLILIVVAALAAYVPARRATRVDPMVALRTE